MENSELGRELDRDVAGCAAAHQALLATADQVTDGQARQPSSLPHWSVGHVLTHLARNADGHVRLIEAANRGEVAEQYPGEGSRERDIDAGAHRPAQELVSDLRRSIWRLEGAWASLTAEGWTGSGINGARFVAISALPSRRWREAVVHHSDLGLGYTHSNWPSDFVRIELVHMTRTWASRQPMGMTELPAAANALSPATRLAWLIGRVDVPGLAPAGIFT